MSDPQWKKNDPRKQPKIGDHTTSDVIIRLKTDQGRDNELYGHSQILTQKSHFFASHLSSGTPPSLNAKRHLEIYCLETEVNSYIIILRLLYNPEIDMWHGVKNTLGILQAADRLGCHEIAQACMARLEVASWDEDEEEEIIKCIPVLGPSYTQILARLLPVDPSVISNLFFSAVSIATMTPPSSELCELKRSAQEQLEYMLTEDDDSPAIAAKDQLVRTRVRESVGNLMIQMDNELSGGLRLVEYKVLLSLLSDISWMSQILSKMEMMRELVGYWVDRSAAVVVAVEELPTGVGQIEARIRAVEVILKVLETVCCGSTILPAAGRLGLVRAWLPFVQRTRAMIEEEAVEVKVGDELWQSLESAFVLTLLTLPSGDLAGILTSWLRGGRVRYPDLSEVFEVWCYRSKAARRRFRLDGGSMNGAR